MTEPYRGQPSGQWQQPPGPGAQQSQQPPAAPKKSSKVATVLAIIGGVLVLAGIVLGFVWGGGIGRSLPGESTVTQISGETIVTVPADEPRVLYVPEGTRATCEVADPDGNQAVDTMRGSLNFTRNGVRYDSIGQLGGEGQPSGDYTVSCDADGVIAAEAIDVSDLVGGIFGLVMALLVGGLGAVLLIVGIVIRALRR